MSEWIFVAAAFSVGLIIRAWAVAIAVVYRLRTTTKAIEEGWRELNAMITTYDISDIDDAIKVREK